MGERVLQAAERLAEHVDRTAAAPGKTRIDDQSKAFRVANTAHLNRARGESSWLGGKGRFIGRRRLRGRRATNRPRFGRRKLPSRTASRKRCALARVRPGDRERQISCASLAPPAGRRGGSAVQLPNRGTTRVAPAPAWERAKRKARDCELGTTGEAVAAKNCDIPSRVKATRIVARPRKPVESGDARACGKHVQGARSSRIGCKGG